jgi:hypothetical protein
LTGVFLKVAARRFGATLWTQERDFEELPGVRSLA